MEKSWGRKHDSKIRLETHQNLRRYHEDMSRDGHWLGFLKYHWLPVTKCSSVVLFGIIYQLNKCTFVLQIWEEVVGIVKGNYRYVD